ncbi:MAG: four-carbon acid sugar kinase family protein [Pirellula sp.]
MKNPRIAFYGDDFTGSTDVMEVLQWAGIPTILFLASPDREQLDKFTEFQAFGVAGWSRSMSPDEMESDLRPILRQLRDSGAEIVHYKTCSTFDSSPEIGSIGKTMEIGRELYGSEFIPLVVGAPNLGRYQVFGNLFARSGLDSEPFRLDRHPTMMHHPITPMNESDIRRHLARQTQLRIGLYDVLQLQGPIDHGIGKVPLGHGCDGLLFDLLLPEHLPKIGHLLDRIAKDKSPRFMVGSSGIEYALTQYWDLPKPALPSFDRVEQLVVITGSCSPVNERQIEWAEQHGFETLALNPSRLIDNGTSRSEIELVIESAVHCLKQGRNLIMHTSRGPNDARIASAVECMRGMGLSELEIRLQSGRLLGPKLGKLLNEILKVCRLPRVGIAGGDSSGFIARELNLIALQAIAPVAPGSPLCRAHAENEFHGVEFLFKGGQVGKDDVWGTMLHGTNNG